MHTGLRFTKGHGTQNDFVLLPDPDARLSLWLLDIEGRIALGRADASRALRTDERMAEIAAEAAAMRARQPLHKTRGVDLIREDRDR